MGNPGITAASQHHTSPQTQSKCNGSMGDGVEMSRHSVTHRNTGQTLNTLREEQPTEKLDWPVFCGSRKNKENTKEKLDTVSVQRLSSPHTLSREFHASGTHFTRQHRAKNSFPFRSALKMPLLFYFKK